MNMNEGRGKISSYYRGVDFAIAKKSRADLSIVDDGSTLRVCSMNDTTARIAVDCPFGTTVGFQKLIQGHVPSDATRDGFKSRATEHLVRKQVKAFGTCQWWSKSPERKARFPKAGYFNAGGHVQPTLGLVIVPAGLAEVLKLLKLEDATPEARIQGLVLARRGEGTVVEAHPRIFLYTAIERIYELAGRNAVSLDHLRAAARYKVEKEGEGQDQRRRLYALLRDHPAWMGQSSRKLEPEPHDTILESNHGFDAWLCVLTAWAHAQGETLGWNEAGLSPEDVDVEGHMLLLRTAPRPSRSAL